MYLCGVHYFFYPYGNCEYGDLPILFDNEYIHNNDYDHVSNSDKRIATLFWLYNNKFDNYLYDPQDAKAGLQYIANGATGYYSEEGINLVSDRYTDGIQLNCSGGIYYKPNNGEWKCIVPKDKMDYTAYSGGRHRVVQFAYVGGNRFVHATHYTHYGFIFIASIISDPWAALGITHLLDDKGNILDDSGVYRINVFPYINVNSKWFAGGYNWNNKAIVIGDRTYNNNKAHYIIKSSYARWNITCDGASIIIDLPDSVLIAKSYYRY